MNTDYMLPIEQLESVEGDAHSLFGFAQCAESFLRSHPWCRGIVTAYLGFGIDGILGVFLFEIEPDVEGVDRELWVITGDVPPAYLVCEFATKPSEALRLYVEEMRRWVDGVRNGLPLDDVIPVYFQDGGNLIPPTLEFAELLGGRLDFIEEELVPEAELEEAEVT